ncbi:MAG: hypothetical protein IT366_25075 [Candidatus Hydrogenedentes bacterium]|nr:hypothetical protein [Candidatus Hydrogenedentota bacterium]
MRAVTAQRFAQGLFLLCAVFLAVAMAQFAVRTTLRARADAACERNLRQIAVALQNYAQKARGERYPALSSVPGQLMFSMSEISALDPHLEVTLGSTVDKTRYWYLGWMFANERTALEWIEQYRRHVPRGEPIPEGHGVWPEFEDDIAARQRAGDIEWHKTHPDGKPHHPEKGRGPEGNAAAIGPRLEELRLSLPLCEGGERFFATDIGTPPNIQIPVLIERPELHGGGGHVLYLDGHIAFVPYPAKFPMTSNFIEGLRSLDALNSEEKR